MSILSLFASHHQKSDMDRCTLDATASIFIWIDHKISVPFKGSFKSYQSKSQWETAITWDCRHLNFCFVGWFLWFKIGITNSIRYIVNICHLCSSGVCAICFSTNSVIFTIATLSVCAAHILLLLCESIEMHFFFVFHTFNPKIYRQFLSRVAHFSISLFFMTGIDNLTMARSMLCFSAWLFACITLCSYYIHWLYGYG